MRRSILMYLLLSSCFFITAARAEDKAALQAQLDRVDKLTALDSPELKPWAMKLSFQLDDDTGKLKEQGTIEEWWAGPSVYKISITSPSYTATTIVNKDGRFRTTGAKDTPYLLEVLERQLVHPLPRPAEVSGLSPMTVKIEGVTGPVPNCIMLFAPMRHVPFPPMGLMPTYCMVPGKDLLQVSYDYGNLMVERTAMGQFQQKVMPIDVKVAIDRIDAAASHLMMLKAMTGLTDADFAVPASGMERVDTPVVHVLYHDLVPEIATAPQRAIPAGVQPSSMSYPVEVAIRIGTDGVVHRQRLMGTPDVRLAAPAMWMIAHTKFTPHLVNGKPTEVDTLADIYFSSTVGVGEIGKKR